MRAKLHQELSLDLRSSEHFSPSKPINIYYLLGKEKFVFVIVPGMQYANAKCGNIFLFFNFDAMKKENAETVFKENKKTIDRFT